MPVQHAIQRNVLQVGSEFVLYTTKKKFSPFWLLNIFIDTTLKGRWFQKVARLPSS